MGYQVKIIEGVLWEDVERNSNKWLAEQKKYIENVSIQYIPRDKGTHFVVITYRERVHII